MSFGIAAGEILFVESDLGGGVTFLFKGTYKLIACVFFYGLFSLVQSKVADGKHMPRVMDFIKHIGINSLPIYLIHYFYLPRVPFVGKALREVLTSSYTLPAELLVGIISASATIALTLATIYVIRLSCTLRFLLLGEK